MFSTLNFYCQLFSLELRFFETCSLIAILSKPVLKTVSFLMYFLELLVRDQCRKHHNVFLAIFGMINQYGLICMFLYPFDDTFSIH